MYRPPGGMPMAMPGMMPGMMTGQAGGILAGQAHHLHFCTKESSSSISMYSDMCAHSCMNTCRDAYAYQITCVYAAFMGTLSRFYLRLCTYLQRQRVHAMQYVAAFAVDSFMQNVQYDSIAPGTFYVGHCSSKGQLYHMPLQDDDIWMLAKMPLQSLAVMSVFPKNQEVLETEGMKACYVMASSAAELHVLKTDLQHMLVVLIRLVLYGHVSHATVSGGIAPIMTVCVARPDASLVFYFLSRGIHLPLLTDDLCSSSSNSSSSLFTYV